MSTPRFAIALLAIATILGLLTTSRNQKSGRDYIQRPNRLSHKNHSLSYEHPGLAAPDSPSLAHLAQMDVGPPAASSEHYILINENPFRRVVNNPHSTFAIDVDDASYSNVRRFINEGRLPPKDAVRLEELINYFKYDYPQPEGDQPFSDATKVSAAPWNANHR